MNLTVSFVYCTILTIVYTGALSFSCCLYLMRRKKELIPVIGLFAAFLLDNVIIFMTEQLPGFARWYNRTFLASPSVKSVIFLGLGFFTLCVWNVLARHRFSPMQGFILILLGLWLFFVPLMDGGSLEVWLYFLGYQLFIIGTASYGLWKVGKLDLKNRIVSRKEVKTLLVCMIVLSLMIVGEDTYVIFNVDHYDVDYLDIFSRSISEDVMRVFFTAFCFTLFAKLLRRDPAAPPGAVPGEAPAQAEAAAEVPSNAALDYKRLKYARSCGFTDREMEVFVLMLGNLNYQQISETLHISLGTAKTHAHNIFRKADVTHRYELLRQFEEFPADAPF